MKNIVAFGPIRDDVFDRHYFSVTEALAKIGLAVPEKDFFRRHSGEIICLTAITRKPRRSRNGGGGSPKPAPQEPPR